MEDGPAAAAQAEIDADAGTETGRARALFPRLRRDGPKGAAQQRHREAWETAHLHRVRLQRRRLAGVDGAGGNVQRGLSGARGIALAEHDNADALAAAPGVDGRP